MKIHSPFYINTRISARLSFHSRRGIHKHGQQTLLIRNLQNHRINIFSMRIHKVSLFSISSSSPNNTSNNDGNHNKRKISEEPLRLLQKEKKQKEKVDDKYNSQKYISIFFSYFKNERNLYLSEQAKSKFLIFKTELSKTWTELLNSSQPSDINKKLKNKKTTKHYSSPNVDEKDIDNFAADQYKGTTAIMTIDDVDNVDTFERMRRRLSEAPIIQDFFQRVEKIYVESGAKAAKEKLQDAKEDAKEAWETSQNPWVYRVSNVYDTLTAENEFGMAERYLRDLDPKFSLESWKHDCVEIMLPKIMHLFLSGRIQDLKPHLGKALYNRLSAEARARKKEGKIVDNNVLDITHAEILTCTVDDKTTSDEYENDSPIIMLQFMCQQIHCVRNEAGKIVEGSEDDIRLYSYVAAFRRNYDDVSGELNWIIVDFLLNGAIAYL